MKDGCFVRDGKKIVQQMLEWSRDNEQSKGLRKVMEERGYDLGSGKN